MTGAAQMLTVRVPMAVRKPRGGRKTVLKPGGMANRSDAAAVETVVPMADHVGLRHRAKIAPGKTWSAKPCVSVSSTL